MPVIWKYQLPANGHITLELPQYAEVISAHSQGDDICLWAIVGPTHVTELRRFVALPTGKEFDYPDRELELIDSVFLGPLVFHVFEILNP